MQTPATPGKRAARRNPRYTVLVLFLVGATPFLQASACIDLTTPLSTVADSVDRINGLVSHAVDTLGQQSTAWQGTLTNLEASLAADASNMERQVAQHASDLEKQLVSDVHGLVDHVDTVVKDGAQFAQESFNCQQDIFSGHARVAVLNFLNAFLNKYNYKGISNRPVVPQVPIVCSANPNGVNVGSWDLTKYLALSGTDLSLFGAQPPTVVVVKANGSTTRVENMGSRVTNYRYELNVPAMISQNLLKDAVQLQVQWNGQKVNQNEIPVVSCGARGQPCCRGARCDSGSACASDVCTACGGLNQPCCDGRACSAGNCDVTNVCTTQCGGPNQPCCAQNVCNSGNLCRSGTCKACASGPCGSCGGTLSCDGTCSVPTPPDFGQVRLYANPAPVESFTCCWIDYTKTFGGNCSPGWVFNEPAGIVKLGGGGGCEIVSSGGGNNCRVTVRFHNNGTDGATCRIVINERRACGP